MALSLLRHCMSLCLLSLWACAAMAQDFDRVAAGTQYRSWLQQFHTDLQATLREVPRDEDITIAQVNRWCAGSVVPGSRAAGNVVQWLNASRQHGERTVSGEIVYRGPMTVLLHLFRSSIPAGEGGLYPEPEGSPYPDGQLSVWYMHIHSGDLLQDYFDHPKRFAPYRLPPAGVLERNAYPFLLFQLHEGRLRFGGVGQEWWGAFETLYNKQFF